MYSIIILHCLLWHITHTAVKSSLKLSHKELIQEDKAARYGETWSNVVKH